MVYVDTTLTPDAANGYSYVNVKQVYDLVANAMTTHPAWDFVEYVDAVNASNTYRRYVWKCNAAQSGLAADFFVVFQPGYFTTAAGAVTGWTTGGQCRVYLGETYAAGVLGKFASAPYSLTLAADLSNPATWALSTYAEPASIYIYQNKFGLTTASMTSFRWAGVVAKDVLILPKASNSLDQATTTDLLYVGAYDSVMTAGVDPLPIVICGSGGQNYGSPWPAGSGTRAPMLTPATAYTDAMTVRSLGTVNTGAIGDQGSWELNSGLTQGVVGNPAITSWFKNFNGPLVSRIMIFPATTVNSSRAFRGYFKYLYGAYVASHSFGDTFLVDGKVCLGNGNTTTALINTEAL